MPRDQRKCCAQIPCIPLRCNNRKKVKPVSAFLSAPVKTGEKENQTKPEGCETLKTLFPPPNSSSSFHHAASPCLFRILLEKVCTAEIVNSIPTLHFSTELSLRITIFSQIIMLKYALPSQLSLSRTRSIFL